MARDRGTGLESLSIELFDEIVSCLAVRDKASMCQVSHFAQDRTIPKLYSSWEYHGQIHSFKSLHSFLRTVIQNPGLAAYVRKLDVRDWGDTPKEEEFEGFPDEDSYSDGETDSDGESDPDGGLDPEGESNHREELENEFSSSSESNGGGISNENYDKDFPIIQQSVHDLAFGPDWENDRALGIRDRKENELMALLASRLPNLEELYMVMPEVEFGDDYGIPQLVEQLAETDSSVLSNLQTIYVASALHIGIKGHREYYLELKYIHPLLSSKVLLNLYLLTPFEGAYPGYPGSYPILDKLPGTSNIQNLIIDQPVTNPFEMMKLVRVPKALKSLAIYQDISCFSIGSCFHPLFKFYGETIRVHRDSLEILDLNIYRYVCVGKGHAFNPSALSEDKMDMYKNPKDWKDCHLIGSLKEFTKLKSLSIDVSALCGDLKWGTAPEEMDALLPYSLECLKLRVTMIQAAASRQLEFQNKLHWLRQLTKVVKTAERSHPSLKKVVILTQGPVYLDFKDDLIFKELREACSIARIHFEEVVVPVGGAKVPFFQRLEENRNPGRDF